MGEIYGRDLFYFVHPSWIPGLSTILEGDDSANEGDCSFNFIGKTSRGHVTPCYYVNAKAIQT
jgi:hypothetical protein